MSSESASKHAHAIGKRIQDLDTPALLLDIQACDRNLRKMADFFRDRPCQARPHFKNHKCVTLARRQLAAGSAAGMTCAKLGEAEILADHGFDNILIANQVVGPGKMQRLAEVARREKIALAVDHTSQVTALSQAAIANGVTIGVLIEVDVGMGRCGVQPGEPVLELARQIVTAPGLRFDGLQAYEGHTVYIADFNERRDKTVRSMQHALDSKALLESKGIAVPALSGGASATYNITGVLPGWREIQCGTYATMDWRYAQAVPEFDIAMTVLVTVISRPRPGVAVIDLGVKGAGGEFGLPRIKNCPDIEVPFFIAEEHTVLKNGPDWKVGQTIELISSHACTTCNLHRCFYVHENGRVVDVWPIEASGKLT